ncbi:hypothetical protein MMC29_002438 [Sticta canariensis]|nr:hypothetical protein [Sticta canariensis]
MAKNRRRPNTSEGQLYLDRLPGRSTFADQHNACKSSTLELSFTTGPLLLSYLLALKHLPPLCLPPPLSPSLIWTLQLPVSPLLPLCSHHLFTSQFQQGIMAQAEA